MRDESVGQQLELGLDLKFNRLCHVIFIKNRNTVQY